MQRSRPRVFSTAHRSARSNSHRSPDRIRRRTSLVATSRSAPRAAARMFGSWSSPAWRMRSMIASGSDGSVPHTSQAISHSLGPRGPCLARNAPKAERNASVPVAAANRSTRPGTPSSNSAPSRGSDRTRRLRSHRAKDGSAESTPPSPPRSANAFEGSPRRRRQSWRRTSSPMPAPPVMTRWTVKSLLNMGSASTAAAASSSSVAVATSGRVARHRSTSRIPASRSGRSVAARILHPYLSPRSVASRFRSARFATWGGARASDPRKVASASSGVVPGVRMASTRGTERFRYMYPPNTPMNTSPASSHSAAVSIPVADSTSRAGSPPKAVARPADNGNTGCG